MLAALNELNPQQRAAVEAIEGPILVLAGAGSGKTRVITTKIMHLMDLGVHPYRILGMTFTNKAAGEMRQRVAKTLGENAARDLTLTTFHSFCARFLRKEIGYLDRETNFVIFDSQDQKTCLKRVIRELHIPEKRYPLDRLRALISKYKNKRGGEGVTLNEAEQEVYQAYMDEMHAQNALDFDDLIAFTCDILSQFEDCRERYQRRYQYIMVDEYQDTNPIQAELINLLLNQDRNLCVVGDEDQSIYGWRGAEIRNILDFDHNYPGARIFKLEQNYRSSQRILDYANDIISQNQLRKHKSLWTEAGLGRPISLRTEQNAIAEAEFIVQKILTSSKAENLAYHQFAVLFRSNYLSRVLEELFRRYQVPYQLIGGLKFYDRKEIKDLLAYMRIVVNPRDWTSFSRALGVPSRGIGAKSQDALYSLFQSGLDVGQILKRVIDHSLVATRTMKGIKAFAALYEKMRQWSETLKPSEWLEHLINALDYLEYLERTDEVTADSRADNIRELQASMVEAERQGILTLAQFMDQTALVSDQDELEDDKPKVNLMTIHAAKGLEFHTVFVMGLEEGVFPNQRSLDSHTQALEEERRLYYVAITRAEKQLFLSHARRRQTYGTTTANMRSRFLSIPLRTYDDSGPEPVLEKKKVKLDNLASQLERMKAQLKQQNVDVNFETLSPKPAKAVRLRPGDVVRHQKFGTGTISSVRGNGDLQTISVYFPGQGVKKLLASKAKLEKVHDRPGF